MKSGAAGSVKRNSSGWDMESANVIEACGGIGQRLATDNSTYGEFPKMKRNSCGRFIDVVFVKLLCADC